ncbi:helix-turn-helix domain-containing protein [Novacetimonas pomaceti]|uniref:XRE family transcriptional regulator n=1 Tax=Novacetimonas pomaceti TaxID=2021998 RepID=A0ABX5P1V8_9PROT|nr:helix-turn-helix transcriptional regulator [Novacetimonas pomaceti]MBV1834972.1 helix-turn-helix domain-containing protein [Novacetimonas pomaceti]PYD47174.1 hypothetical protein C3920_11330 [Novacetimonas pomaceti]
MTPTRLRECLALLRWSQRGLADVLDTHQTTVRRWATGAQPIPENVAAWLERLAKVHALYEYPEDWRQRNPDSVKSAVP